MKLESRTIAGFLTIVVLVMLAGCKSAAPPPPPPPTAPAAEPATASSVPEEQVTEPKTETIMSEEVTTELPEDLEVLNARGYLQDVFFDTDRWDIKPAFREALAKNAAWLQKYPSVQVLIEGHCDERNTREYNIALGDRRANAVRDYLVFLGVAPDRISTRSYGEERPFAMGHNEDAWKLNRRAHFVIIAR
jgi:peptidoglycan-associated lipoprotein